MYIILKRKEIEGERGREKIQLENYINICVKVEEGGGLLIGFEEYPLY